MHTEHQTTAEQVLAALSQGPEALVALLAAQFIAIPGVRTMTLLGRTADGSKMRRIGTSDPKHFPLGGSDPIDDSPWPHRILVEKLPIIGNTPAEMAAYIPETAHLEAIGFGSTVCIPIVIGSETRGTVNLLGAEGVFTPAVLAEVTALLPVAALLFTFDGIADR